MGKTLSTIFKEEGVHPWATILVGLLYVSAFLFFGYEVIKAPVKESDLKVVTGKLLTEPAVTLPGNSPKNRTPGSIAFRLSGYSDLVFMIIGNSYVAARRSELLGDLHRQDSVQFLIEREIYQKKFDRKEDDGFLKSLSGGNKIPVYGIAGKNQVYLRPGDIEYSKTNPATFLLLITASGAWLFRDILKKFISRQG